MTTTAQSPAQTTIVPEGVWNIDASHSSIGFSVKHMMIATVRGAFRAFEGSVTADAAGAVAIRGVIEAASIDTNTEQRDEHLRSADFFDAANHPQITFTSHRVERDGGDYRIHGDLTIRGTTLPVELTAESGGAGTDPWGNPRVALEARGEISRGEFGLKWNQALETGGVLVSDRVKIALELSLVKAQ